MKPFGVNALEIADILPYVKRIDQRHGGKTKVLVYMKKSDVKVARKEAQKNLSSFPVMIEKNIVMDYQRDTLTNTVMALKNFNAVCLFFEDCKEKSVVSNYGSLKSVSDLSDKYIVFFEKDTKTVKSILSPVQKGTERINLVNGHVETAESYHDVFALWYSIRRGK